MQVVQAGSHTWSGSQDPTWLGAKKNQNIKQKQYCNKYNKDFKNGPHPKKKKKQQGMGWSEVSHQTESLVLDWRWDDLLSIPSLWQYLQPTDSRHYARLPLIMQPNSLWDDLIKTVAILISILRF